MYLKYIIIILISSLLQHTFAHIQFSNFHPPAMLDVGPQLQIPPTNRSLVNAPSTQITTIVQQRCSQILLLNLLRNLTILYLIMGILSVPIWTMSGICFGKYIQNQKVKGNKIDKWDYIMIVTSGSLHYQEQEGTEIMRVNIENENNSDNEMKMSEFFISNSANNNQQPPQLFLFICLWIDSALQIVLVIGCAFLEYISFKIKQKHKGNHIQDYSLQITNLPVLHPYIILPKLQQHLLANLVSKFEMVAGNMRIFDLTSAFAEQKNREQELRKELNEKINQQLYANNQLQFTQYRREIGQKIKKISRQINKLNLKRAVNDTIWVTFQTRQARYLALRMIQSSSSTFMNCHLHAEKAPHPSQIIWTNLHLKPYKIYISQIISILICMGSLLVFDLLILYVHKAARVILASIVIFLLEMLLKEIIILTVNNIERHKYISKMNLSLFCKLSKFLFVNSALIIFISSFNFGDNNLVKTFSVRKYDYIDFQWYRTVGVNIMLNFLISLIYVNIRPFVQIFKSYLFTKLSDIMKGIKNGNGLSFRNSQIGQVKLKSQLDICYAQIISFIMFANAYTFTHPIFYPLCALCTFLSIYSHRKYIAYFAEPASYNNDDLNDTAIQYIYASILIHWLIVFVGYGFLPALILFCVGSGILFFKNTLISLISDFARKKFGPFCFSKFQVIHTSTVPLGSLLSRSQLSQYILVFQSKIRKYTYIYNSTFEKQDFVNKGCLSRYIKEMEEKIKKLEGQKEETYNTKNSLLNKGRVQKEVNWSGEIKGNINYSIPTDPTAV